MAPSENRVPDADFGSTDRGAAEGCTEVLMGSGLESSEVCCTADSTFSNKTKDPRSFLTPEILVQHPGCWYQRNMSSPGRVDLAA